jgi:hypothetical protein
VLNLFFPIVGLILFFVLAGVALLLAGILLFVVYSALSVLWSRIRGTNSAASPSVKQCVLQTPALRVELEELNWQNDVPMRQVVENWFEDFSDDDVGPCLLLTTPDVTGLHGQLVSRFRLMWGRGVLLQLVRPTAPGASELTSALVYVDGETREWYEVEGIGRVVLFPSADDPTRINVFDYVSPQQVQLHLEEV